MLHQGAVASHPRGCQHFSTEEIYTPPPPLWYQVVGGGTMAGASPGRPVSVTRGCEPLVIKSLQKLGNLIGYFGKGPGLCQIQVNIISGEQGNSLSLSLSLSLVTCTHPVHSHNLCHQGAHGHVGPQQIMWDLKD